jgi:hypothetical protein
MLCLDFKNLFVKIKIMHPFKFIEIPNYDALVVEILKYLNEKTTAISEPKSGMNPEATWNWLDPNPLLDNVPALAQWITQHGLVVRYVALIGLTSRAENLLHTDDDLPDGKVDVRILLPLQNTSGSITRFYDVPPDQIVAQSTPDGTIYKAIVGEGPFPLISELELTKPIVFNSSIPHDIVVNRQAGFRLSLAIGFIDPPYSWLED